jgi:hypothetical protein
MRSRLAVPRRSAKTGRSGETPGPGLHTLLLTPLFHQADKAPPITESSVLQTSPVLAGLFGVETRPISMVGHYKNRCGQGKCEANCFLRNRTGIACDSESHAEAEIDKTFVIQNLFRQWRKLQSRGKFF